MRSPHTLVRRIPQRSLLESSSSLFFVAVFLCSPPLAHSLFFKATSFNGGSNIMAYQGDAMPANGSIELTVPDIFRVGHATYGQPIHLWDSSSGILTDFTTRFSFTIDNLNQTSYGDGLAFFIAPSGYSIPPNSGGYLLGLLNTTTENGSPQNKIIFVEFDMCMNNYIDPKFLHVGINKNSIRSLDTAFFDIVNNFGNRCHALVSYNSSTKDLAVSWSFNATSTGHLSYRIDLMEALPEWVTIGFSASTGSLNERHIIHSWEFNSTLDSQFSEVAPNKDNKRRNKVLVPGLAATCSFVFVLLMCLGICWFIVKRKRKEGVKKMEVTRFESNLNGAAIPRRFHYHELVTATDDFADDRRLGQGGSGQVFKGVLRNTQRVVAIKRISTNYEHSERVFINEVKIISRLIHRNLVQFIGWCHGQREFLLIFEYMPNGSLDTHLYGDKRTILPWDVRYKIALEMATALHYLHEEAEQSVIHRDIKSANVLLDTDFNAKLGDFGVSKLADPRTRTQKTALVGTLGYLAPEYINGGRASKESDMYSFGVVALEIACGRRNYQDGEYHVPIVNWVWQQYVEGTVLNVADEGLRGEFKESEMRCLLTLGLWCTHPKDKERPKASQVIKALQLEAALPTLPHDMHDFAPISYTLHSNSFQSAPITTSLGSVGR